MAAQFGGLQVVPAAAAWTEFEVHDTDGAVRIIARKGDVKLIDASGTTTLAEGQEASRDETSQKGKEKAGTWRCCFGSGWRSSKLSLCSGSGVVGGIRPGP